MKIENYKHQEKQETSFSRNRTERRNREKLCNNLYKIYANIIDPYWWSHLSLSEKYVIYNTVSRVPNGAKKMWFDTMYDEYNKKKEIRNSKIDILLMKT
jgi:hypothetical protein